MEHLTKYLLAFFTSVFLVLVLTPIFIRLAPLLGLVDHPDGRRIHSKSTPLAGGFVVFLSVNITCWLVYNYFWPEFKGRLDFNWWHAFFISSSILVLVGLIDDRVGMSPLVKLLGQIVAALTMYFLSNENGSLLQFDFGLLGTIVFILLWNLVIINSFNLIDGLDGLCSGLALISAVGLSIVFVLRDFPGDGLVCLSVVGSCLGFLRYNFHPAKIFLGDTGSMFLGFALANISLHAGGKGSLLVLVLIPFFVAGVPIFDTCLAIWRRSIRKFLLKDQKEVTMNVTGADCDHLHHRLINLGFNQKQVALYLYAANACIIAIGVLYIISKEISVGLFLIILIGIVYLLVKHVLHIELWETCRLFARTVDHSTTTHYGLIGYCLFDLTWLVLMELLSEFILLEDSRSLISISNWLTDLSVWVMPIFSFLIITNTYVRIWRNGFFRDYIILVLAIFSGCIFTLALLFIFNKESVFYCVNQVVLFCFFSLIGIVGVRIFHQFLREWGFSRANSHVHNRKNMLVYGASGHGGLYIRELYLRYAEELGKIQVVGFVDDNKALHRQYTFGLLVLGGACELEKLILQYKINQIVLTVRLPKEKFHTLIELCSRMGVELLVWNSFAYTPSGSSD